MTPSNKKLRAMIARGRSFTSFTNDEEAHELLNACLELQDARKALRSIAAGEGYYGAQAKEYKDIAAAHFAMHPVYDWDNV